MPSPLDYAQSAKSYTDLQNLQGEFDARKAIAAAQLGQAAGQAQLLPGQLQAQQLQLLGAQRQQAALALGAATPDNYSAIKQSLGSYGKFLPDNYDPAVVQSLQNSLITPQEKISNALAQQTLAETVRANRAKESNESGGFNLPGQDTGTPAPSPAGAGGIVGSPSQAVNNPGNLRPVGATTGFMSYPTPQAGMQALNDDIMAKVTGKSSVMGNLQPTLTNVISKYAPAGDGNNPAAYTATVAQATGLDPNAVINPADVPKITTAMANVEGNTNTTGATNQFAGPGAPTQNGPLHGEDFLNALEKQYPNAPVGPIRAMANGDLPIPTGRALVSPINMKMLNGAMQANPSLNAQTYQVKQDFDTGAQGNQVRSFNVAITHLDLLQKLGDALQNGNAPLINKLSNTYAEQTGQPAPSNFDAVNQLAKDEVVKSIIGGATGVGDREDAEKTFNNASSPAQITGVINNYKSLMAGQLGGLQKQYESSTGLKDFNKKLLPGTISALSTHNPQSLQPGTSTINLKNIPGKSLAALKANPNQINPLNGNTLRADFDAKYGPGASQMLIGQPVEEADDGE